MGDLWFTSDTHFRHTKVAEIRGIGTVEEHDEMIIESWNSVVKPGDVVWHLGDVGMGSSSKIFPLVDQLAGVKHLVTGNHDGCWPGHRDSHKQQRAWLEHFASVQAFAKRKVNDRVVLLSHFPYHGDHTDEDRFSEFRLRDAGKMYSLLHGHTHSKERFTFPRQIHVGWDAWGRPVNVSEIATRLS